MNKVFILLGSNKGHRLKNLLMAQYFLKHKIGEIVASTSIYETEPWMVNHKTRYLNQCLKIHTNLSIFQLLNRTQKIENKLGRKNKNQLASRTIDIDILYFNDMVLNSNQLVIPHPRLHLRKFTLIPLNEIESDYLHPILKQTNFQLLLNCIDNTEVKLYNSSTFDVQNAK